MQKSKLRGVNKIQKRATGQENTREDNLSIHEHRRREKSEEVETPEKLLILIAIR